MAGVFAAVRRRALFALLAASALSIVSIAPASAWIDLNCSATSGPRVTRIGGTAACPDYAWCDPLGKPGAGKRALGGRRCGPPGPGLYAAWGLEPPAKAAGKQPATAAERPQTTKPSTKVTEAAKPREAAAAPARTTEPPPAPQSNTPAPVTPWPTADAHTLRAQQGTCSDITGTGGGGGPINCQRYNDNAVPANVQAQIARAKPGTYTSDPGAGAANTALLAEFNSMRAAAIAARDAGDALNAFFDWKAAADARDKLHANGQMLCPPVAPASYWEHADRETAAYCGGANCAERESAYYGMTCFPTATRDYASLPSIAERTRICAEALAQLKPHAPDDAWLEDRMAHGEIPCHGNGDPFTLDEILKGRMSDARQRLIQKFHTNANDRQSDSAVPQ